MDKASLAKHTQPKKQLGGTVGKKPQAVMAAVDRTGGVVLIPIAWDKAVRKLSHAIRALRTVDLGLRVRSILSWWV